MRTIYLSEDRQLGAAKRRHKFTFGPERTTPSGIEAPAYLGSQEIGVARGIDTVGPKGGSLRIWEVQLMDYSVAHGNSLTLALKSALPRVLRLTSPDG